MKTYIKKILLIVVFALIVCINFRIHAKAETTEYEVWIAGEQITSENMSGEGWSFEPADISDSDSIAKLYLTNANIVGNDNGGIDEAWGNCIESDASLEIVLTGENRISLNMENKDSSYIAIASEEKIYFSGEGSLVIDCNDFTVTNEEFSDICLIEAFRITFEENVKVVVKGSNVETNTTGSSYYNFNCMSSEELILGSGAQLLVEGFSINDKTGLGIINDTSVHNSKTQLLYESTLSIAGGDMVGSIWTTGLRANVLEIGAYSKYSASSGQVTGDMCISCGTQVEEELIIGDNVKADFESGEINSLKNYNDNGSYGLFAITITVGKKSVITSKSSNTNVDNCGVGVKAKTITLGKDSVIRGYGNYGGVVLTVVPEYAYYVIGGENEEEAEDLSISTETDAQMGCYRYLYGNRVANYVQIAPKLIIRLEANGGKAEKSAIYLNNGEEVGELPTPTWEGYIFKGWYTKAEGGERVYPTTRMTENCGIFAIWELDPTYEIKVVESGSCGENAAYTIDNLGTVRISGTGMIDQKVFRARIDIKKVFISEGITHIGDNEFQNCHCLIYVSLPKSIVSIGNYAFANCYKMSNNFLETDNWRVVGISAFHCCATIEYIMLPDMIAVIGNGAFSYCSSLTIRCTKDSKGQFYAITNEVKWENFWKISFDANGGKVSENIKYPTNNTSIGTLPTPTRTNYAFKGWYTDKTNGTKVTSQTKATENMTLYARWEVVKPNTMLGFTYSERTSNSVTLKWTKNTSADGYVIQQYKSGGWTTIKTITSNSTVKYKVTSLKPSVNYKFRIKAYKMDGDKKLYAPSYSTKSVRTLPSTVKAFSYKARTKTTITLRWNKNTSADGYIIQQYKGGKWTTIKTLTKNSTVRYKVTGLKKGINYKFRIKAYKMDGSKKLYSLSYTTKRIKTLK